MPPVAFAVAGLALSAIGTGVGVYSSVAAGEAADDASKRQQKASNAQAQTAQDAAALEAGQVRRKNLIRMGEQRAAGAKSGVMINDSTSDVIYDSSVQGELEALSTLYSGASQASYNRSQGRAARAEGKAAKSAGYVKGAGTLIGGAGSIASEVSKNPSFFKK